MCIRDRVKDMIQKYLPGKHSVDKLPYKTGIIRPALCYYLIGGYIRISSFFYRQKYVKCCFPVAVHQSLLPLIASILRRLATATARDATYVMAAADSTFFAPLSSS